MITSLTKTDLDQNVQYGHELAEGKWKGLVKGLDPYRAMLTAMLAENTRQYIDNMDETTRVTSVGAYDKYNFPMLRAVVPNLVSTEIFTTQPMTGPSSLIFFMEFVYGKSKGGITAGSKMYDFLTGPNATQDYTSEKVDTEVLGTTAATANTGYSTASYTAGGAFGAASETTVTLTKLAFKPIRPGTVKILFEGATPGEYTVQGQDNGAGRFTATSGATPGITGASSAVDYATGDIYITFAANPADSKKIAVTYEYISEAMSGDDIPDVDILITSSAVTAKSRKMKARWSMEAANWMRSQYGNMADVEVTAAMSEKVKFEIDREMIDLAHSVIPSGHVETFVQNAGITAVSYTEHKLMFYDKLVRASNAVFETTKRIQPNWIVADVTACNIIETLPGFKAFPMISTVGVQKIGILMNRWVVYKDPFLSPKAAYGDGSNKGIAILGYKGNSFLESLLVYAPFVPLVLTPIITLDDFVARLGVLTQYATKVVNPNGFAKVLIDADVIPNG